MRAPALFHLTVDVDRSVEGKPRPRVRVNGRPTYLGHAGSFSRGFEGELLAVGIASDVHFLLSLLIEEGALCGTTLGLLAEDGKEIDLKAAEESWFRRYGLERKKEES